MTPNNTDELDPVAVVDTFPDNSGLRNRLPEEAVTDVSIVGALRAAMLERESAEPVVDLREGKRGRRSRRRK
jgi:hypothetical protein